MTRFSGDSAPIALKKLRDRAGLSMDELARRAGYAHASGLQRYENPEQYKKRYFSLELVRKLAAALVGPGDPEITEDEVYEALAGIPAPTPRNAAASEKGSARIRDPLAAPRRVLDLGLQTSPSANPLISQSKINQQIGRNLTLARESRNLTIAALAEKAGVAVALLERCEHGDEVPANDILRHLEDVLDAPLIIEAEASSFRESDFQSSGGQIIDEYDVRGGMGNGERPDHDNPTATWMVPSGHFGRGDLIIMGSRGNSMEPTLLSGDRVVVDRADRDASHGGIFAIRDNESSKIKRIETVTGSKPRRLRILSENPLHQPEEVDLADDLIIGRVVGLIRRL